MFKNIKAGDRIVQAALVRVQRVGNSNNGGVFARGVLEDNSGRIAFICFEGATVERLRSMDGPQALMVAGAVDVNKLANDGSLQVIVQKAEPLMPQDDITHLLPYGKFNHEEYKLKLTNYIKLVRTPVLRQILEKIFEGAMLEKFLKNPAGTKMHHAYLGGLLQHSVDVCSLAVAMAGQMDKVDMDLVITGSLLHDIGKLKEISAQIGFPYTDTGRLLGHVSMSAMLVQEMAIGLHIPMQRIDGLLHILLSHHGEQEKGSPVACATKEAFLVHYADEINAIMNQFDTYEDKNPWEFNNMLHRFIMH